MACSCGSGKKGFICFWEIENFAECKYRENLELTSQTFDVNMMNKSRWYLKLKRQVDRYAVFLHKNEAPLGFIIIHFSSSILTNYGWSEEYHLMNQTFDCELGQSGFGIFLPEDKNLFSVKGDLLPHGSLTIKIHMYNDTIKNKYDQCFLKSLVTNGKLLHYFPKQHYHEVGQSISTLGSNVFSKIRLPDVSSKPLAVPKVVQDKNTQTDSEESKNVFNDTEELLNFFAEKKFSYVILRTLSKEFAVHKALICARSPVFCAMFDKDMKENHENIVDIHDVDSETLMNLIRFLHLETLGNPDWETTTKLYYAADKYQIQQLKNECRSLLKNKMTAENVSELFILSDMHQDQELKQCAQDYFCNHSKNILRTEEWKDLLLNRVELACEILHKYAERP